MEIAIMRYFISASTDDNKTAMKKHVIYTVAVASICRSILVKIQTNLIFSSKLKSQNKLKVTM